MNGNAFIPNTIKVGFQERQDTYSGKLAYVIYYDEKNKLRKEPSWNSWRDKNIEPQEFENEPLDGFVLNKKTGDYKDWFHRQAYIRVFDPRGFEIEITVNNLLYILENCNSIKGKGLDGRFCYGWVGPDLLLLPENSRSFKDSREYSDLLYGKKSVKIKDFEIGQVYLMKNNKRVIYLGKEPVFYYNSYYATPYYVYEGVKHLFIYEESWNNPWWDWNDLKNSNRNIDTINSFVPIKQCDEKYDVSVAMNTINAMSKHSGQARIHYKLPELKKKLKNFPSFYGMIQGTKALFNYSQHCNYYIWEDSRCSGFYNKKYYTMSNLASDVYYLGEFDNGNLVSKNCEIEIVV